jgi:hypothetical protein
MNLICCFLKFIYSSYAFRTARFPNWPHVPANEWLQLVTVSCHAVKRSSYEETEGTRSQNDQFRASATKNYPQHTCIHPRGHRVSQLQYVLLGNTNGPTLLSIVVVQSAGAKKGEKRKRDLLRVSLGAVLGVALVVYGWYHCFFLSRAVVICALIPSPAHTPTFQTPARVHSGVHPSSPFPRDKWPKHLLMG